MTSEDGAGPGEAIRVLIVDDDEGHAEALADGLETENCICRIAHSGRAGIELLSESTFDVVLTDKNLPGGPILTTQAGVELVREIRQRDPAVGIVMMTAYGSMESARSYYWIASV